MPTLVAFDLHLNDIPPITFMKSIISNAIDNIIKTIAIEPPNSEVANAVMTKITANASNLHSPRSRQTWQLPTMATATVLILLLATLWQVRVPKNNLVLPLGGKFS
jgi:hypothetical protein